MFYILIFIFIPLITINAVTEERVILLSKQADKLSLDPYPDFKYPADYKELMKLFPKGELYIFGYGSLVNPESAARTLSSDAMKTYEPAVAFGMKRSFDRKVTNTERWGPQERSSDVGMLNVFKTKQADPLNGVTFKVNALDLKSLIEREVGYDLVPVYVISWKKFIDEEEEPDFKIAYVFLAPSDPKNVYVDPCINPVPRYALASKEGAAINGKDFLNLWLKSTFLADRKTPFSQWEKAPSKIDMAKNCLLKKP